MISAVDPTLAAALVKLRNNTELGPRIVAMEKAGFIVNIQPGPLLPNSGTKLVGPFRWDVFINSKGDDALARTKFGVSGTNEENSIAHELGHVYFAYLYDFKKKPRPAVPSPKITAAEWMDVLDEALARQFDNYTRPPGVTIRSVDSLPVPEPTFGNWIKSFFE